LEPWLEDVGAAHLLTASREADLVEVLLQHAAFSESVGAPSVILKGIGHETLTHGRFAAGLWESASTQNETRVAQAPLAAVPEEAAAPALN